MPAPDLFNHAALLVHQARNVDHLAAALLQALQLARDEGDIWTIKLIEAALLAVGERLAWAQVANDH